VSPLSVWSDVAVGTTASLGVLGIVGAIYKFVLVPNLYRELIKPTQETNREMTGGPDEPSVRELVDDLAHKTEELAHKHDQHSGEIEDATLELRAMALMFDGHLEWAQLEVDRLRTERQAMVDAIWAELNRQRDARERRPGQGKHRGDEGP
jgi:hypothetical protein